MQIFQRLFKLAHARENTTSTTNKKGTTSGQEAKSKDIILYKNSGVYQRSKRVKTVDLGCKNFKPFAFFSRKGVAEACFFRTLNLKRPVNFQTRQHWIHSVKMKKEDIARGRGVGNKADSATHAGNKVSPITDAALPSSTSSTNEQCVTLEKKEKLKGDKTKTMSRMKELLRWAGAAKSQKGGKFIGSKVLHFRNRATLKAVPDDDQLSLESPKISFRWDVESCSTSSSAYSAISMASSLRNDQTINMVSLTSTPSHDKDQCITRKGNWITTDSEFVVLEL